jgi:hypothetical protein
MLLLAIVVERGISAAWGSAVLGVNLPGAVREITDRIPRGLLPILNAVVIIIGFLLILAGGAPLILLTLVGLVFIAAVEVTVRAVRRDVPAAVCGVLRLECGSAVPGGYVVALLRPDRTPFHHRHPDSAHAG